MLLHYINAILFAILVIAGCLLLVIWGSGDLTRSRRSRQARRPKASSRRSDPPPSSSTS